MPRDGSGIYTQPFPDVVPTTTIESAVYNGFVNDVETDLNAVRPIVAGGTGANSALGARANIDAEVAGQVVTNYDSHVWENGSFYSAGGATGEPLPGHGHVGTYQAYDTGSGFAIIQCRDVNDPGGPLYYKTKSSGVWEAGWRTVYGQTENDARYVNVAGDVMTGQLGLSYAGPSIVMSKTSGAGGNTTIVSQTANVTRWIMLLGDHAPETGANAGTDFALYSYSDAGGLIGVPLSINRATAAMNIAGTTTINSQLLVDSIITTRNTATTGGLYFGSSGTKHLDYDGSNFVFTGGPVITPNDVFVSGQVWSRPTATTGTFQFGSSGTKYLHYDGASFYFTGGILNLSNDLNVAGNIGVASAGGTGGIYFGTGGTRSFSNDGTKFSLFGGYLDINNGGITSTLPTNGMHLEMIDTTTGLSRRIRNSAGTINFVNHANNSNATNFSNTGDITTTGNFTSGAEIICGYGYKTRAGVVGAYTANYFNIQQGAGQFLWIDATNAGQFYLTSDYRTKKDVVDLPNTWDTVKALRPIKYTQAEFQPPSQAEHVQKMLAKTKDVKADEESIPPVNTAPMYQADDIERWGFIAHELQETLVPSAASGVKDSHDIIQSPNPWTVIAALTKALQEAMTRIEALEAR